MKKYYLALIALISLLYVEGAFADDARMKEVYYVANKIYRINAKIGIQSTIIFADDEIIENIAVGDGVAWQITPNRRANMIFLKPLSANSTTNMTVVTNSRMYFFEISSKQSGAMPFYSIRFSYPKENSDKLPDAVVNFPQNALSTNYSVEPSKLNFDWHRSGDGTLMPKEIFDDGVLTYIKWDKDSPLPAAFSLGEDGGENLVNINLQNDYFVIDNVPNAIILRLGKKMARLDNGVKTIIKEGMIK